MTSICLHCFVEGRVQGVFYRRHTKEQAIAHGITGWVKNLADGRVEVMMCGEQASVFAMRDWLWKGPEQAKVEAVFIEEKLFEKYAQFEIRN